MGLPELTFSLKKAADNVATRVSSGIVAMILRDAKANGLHTINRESDIPSELGAANIAAIKRAMLGYITKPTTLYVSVIGADADIKTGFQALAVHSYDYLVGPVDIASADATALAAQVKAQRTKRYVGKVILPNVAADDEGVINFVSSGIKVGEGTFTAAQDAGRQRSGRHACLLQRHLCGSAGGDRCGYVGRSRQCCGRRQTVSDRRWPTGEAEPCGNE